MADLPDAAAAFAMAQLAAAMAVQDAASHMRRINIIASAALGAAQRVALTTDAGGDAERAANIANAMMQAATANFAAVCDAAGRLGVAPPPTRSETHG